MKTIKQVCLDYPRFTSLIRAVVRNIGKESIQDVNNHGIDGGFSGFIYTRETVAFFKKHRLSILERAAELAGELEGGPTKGGIVSLVQKFNCLHGEFSQDEIAEAIYSPKTADPDIVSQVHNALAWFAAEEVCRMFED